MSAFKADVTNLIIWQWHVAFVWYIWVILCNYNSCEWKAKQRPDCNIGYQKMKMLIYKNCLDWPRFNLNLVNDQNIGNENIGFYLLYFTQGF